MCFICVVGGVASGALGGLFGFEVPKTKKGKLLSGLLTAGATGLTVLALKVMFNISLCGGGPGITLKRVGLILIETIPIALLHGIWINFLVARFGENKSFNQDKLMLHRNKSCCRQNLKVSIPIVIADDNS
jgi:hypothetical protein